MKSSVKNLFVTAAAGAALLLAREPSYAGDAPAATGSTNKIPSITLTAFNKPAANQNSTNAMPVLANPNILTRAGQASMEEGVVGIAIYRGNKERYSGEQIGQLLVSKLKAKGVAAKYFFEDPSDFEETRIDYSIKGIGLGPYSLKGAIYDVQKVANIINARNASKPVAAIDSSGAGPVLAAGN